MPSSVKQPGAAQHLLDFLALAFAPDERRELLRQVVRRRLQFAKSGKILSYSPRVNNLEHGFGGR